MRIRLLSDLHLEFHADGGKCWVGTQDKTDVDLVVLAGDISNRVGIRRALKLIANHFAPVPVLFVTGNHEHYLGGRDDTWGQIKYAVDACPNLHWLNNDVFEFQGKRFLGTTLWFYKSASNGPTWKMNDFLQIKDFSDWVYEENRKAIEFLGREVREGDIVITHYLPSEQCVDPQYKGSDINCFFVCDVTPLIEARKPAFWFFGHTHSSTDIKIGKTRLVCNPFGYARHAENVVFKEKLLIEV